MTTVHALLLQFAAISSEAALECARGAERTVRETLPGIALTRVAYPHASADCYAYLELAAPESLDAKSVKSIESTLNGAEQGQGLSALTVARLSRLQRVMHREGPSVAQAAPVHYVVETDPEEGWKDEMFRWYDEEHMPGLAAVPGTVRAERFLNLDDGPLSLACYDLTEESVMGCPEWLAVRGTEWSSRVRPHFTNTKRTMFDVVLLSVPVGR